VNRHVGRSAEAPVPIAFIENSIGLSGSTMSLATLLRRLDRDRFEPHVIVTREDQEAYLRDIGSAGLQLTRISPRGGVRARPGRLGRVGVLLHLIAATLPYANALRRFVKQHHIRVIHQNNGFDVAALVASRWTGVPLVAYQRGSEWDSRLVRRLAPLTTRYIANSQVTRDNLLRLGISPARVCVVYPPVDLDTFDADRSPAACLTRATLGIPPAAPFVGMVGQLQEWKGHKVFIRAFARVLRVVPEAWACVVGAAPAGGEAYARELHALARELGVSSRIVFAGFIADVPSALQLLDVVVHASVEPEPFGRVIAEAMAMRRPVIASDEGGPREIIEHGRTGLLFPRGNDVALADGVVALLRDPVEAARLAEAGLAEVKQRFSAGQHARLIEEEYRRVLNLETSEVRIP
jgi:glycosyltransferase involved in cell wall biosynthesis